MDGRIGNQFWKLRSKHGRDKLFSTPELLWKAACEYFEWCNNNPWYKVEQVKTAGKAFQDEDGKWVWPPNTIELPISRPMTLTGLCLYLNCNSAYFRTFKAQLPDGEKDFNTIIHAIEETMYTQKFEGAAVGAFNANIIARDLGLRENTDVTSGGKAIANRMQVEVVPPKQDE